MNNSMQKQSEAVIAALQNYQSMASVIPESFLETVPYIFDFTESNLEFAEIDLNDAEDFSNYIADTIAKNGCIYGMGGYGENRILYRRSSLFANEAEPRSIHLGVDLWLPVGTPIFAPLEAKIHSFQDNHAFGDYGGTIILEHSIDNVIFYTLYGHMSRASLDSLRVGQKIEAGQQIASVGNYEENGNWPSHLHFEIITNLLGKYGDFPGVASATEKDYYLTICPDSNLILRIN